MAWNDIVNDEEFKAQPFETRQKVAENYFQQNIATGDFTQQPKEVQDQVRANFMGTIGEPEKSFFSSAVNVAKEGFAKVSAIATKPFEEVKLSEEGQKEIKVAGQSFAKFLAEQPAADVDLQTDYRSLPERAQGKGIIPTLFSENPPKVIGAEFIEKPTKSVIGRALRSVAFLGAGVAASPENKEYLFKQADEITEWLKEQEPGEKVGSIGKFVRGIEELGAKIATGPAAIPIFLMEAGTGAIEYKDQGLDDTTALAMTALDIGTTAMFTQIPMGGKTFAGGIAKGAAINPTIGATSNAVKKGILLAGGYTDQANAIDITNLEQGLNEAFMGIGFGLHQTMAMKIQAPKIAKAIENGDIGPKQYAQHNLQKLYGDWGSKEFETAFPGLAGLTEPTGEVSTGVKAKIKKVLNRYKEEPKEPATVEEAIAEAKPIKSDAPKVEEHWGPVQAAELKKETGLEVSTEQLKGLGKFRVKDNLLKEWYTGAAHNEYLEPLMNWAKQTDTPVGAAHLDIGNLKGLNIKFGHAGADEKFIDITNIVKNTFKEFFPDSEVNFSRSHAAGDELHVEVIGKTAEDVGIIAQEAKKRVEQYAADNGFSELPNDMGIMKPITLHNSTSDVRNFASRKDFYLALDAKKVKKEADNVLGVVDKEVGVGALEKRPGEVVTRSREDTKGTREKGTGELGKEVDTSIEAYSARSTRTIDGLSYEQWKAKVTPSVEAKPAEKVKPQAEPPMAIEPPVKPEAAKAKKEKPKAEEALERVYKEDREPTDEELRAIESGDDVEKALADLDAELNKEYNEYAEQAKKGKSPVEAKRRLVAEEAPSAPRKFIEPKPFLETTVDRPVEDMAKELEATRVTLEKMQEKFAESGFEGASESELAKMDALEDKYRLLHKSVSKKDPGFFIRKSGGGTTVAMGVPTEPVVRGVREVVRYVGESETLDGLARRFAAVTREGAEKSASILSEESSKAARMQDSFEFGMKNAERMFSSLGKGANLDFMQRMDIGAQQRTPELQAVDKALKDMFDLKVTEIQGLGRGALEQVRENYFPHIWKKDEKAMKAFMSRRPFKGSESFTKKRIYDDVRAGLDAGLVPVSNNPIELAMLKLMEMDKYIVANKTINQLKSSGEIKFFRADKRPPKGEDWTVINDKFSTVWRPIKDDTGAIIGRAIAGHYYAKDATAQILNNYLSGNLYSDPGVGKIFSAYMGVANHLNQFQLGFFSAFHAGFTSFETVISQGALGIKQLSEGRFSDAAKSLAKAPVAWINNPKYGNRIMKEWLEPGSQGNEIAQIVDALVASGGRLHSLKGEKFLTTDTKKVLEGWAEGTVKGKLKAAAYTPAAIVEQSARPILEMLVPRQKFGVFGELMHDWIQQNPGASHEETRLAARQFWNRTDSRLGQVVYERLFANNIAKNIVQGLVRAPGWTGGTIIEVGGGVGDSVKLLGNLLEGKGGKVTDRMAYTLSLLVTTAAINTALTYAFTGEKPTPEDMWSFRTGRKDEYGKDERFVLPTYAKDIYAYLHEPGTTLLHKTHPLIPLTADLIKNKDSYTNFQIRDEDANLIMQLAQSGGHAIKQFTPFWLRGAQRARETGKSVGATVAPLVGINPATALMTDTKAWNLIKKYAAGDRGIGGVSKERQISIEAGREQKKQFREGALNEEDLSAKELQRIQKGIDEVAHFKAATSRRTPFEIMRIWKVMSIDEKVKYEMPVRQKIMRATNMTWEDKEKALEMIDKEIEAAPPVKEDKSQS